MKYPFEENQTVLDTPLAKGHLLAKINNRELVYLILKPRGEVPAHALPIHVTFFVSSGGGTLRVEDEVFHAKKGDVLCVEANQDRSWLNNGDEDLELLVIKSQ